VRAIHIEVASSLSADDFILALTRFVARRGCPLEFYSDNGTNLVGSVNELKAALKEIPQDFKDNADKGYQMELQSTVRQPSRGML